MRKYLKLFLIFVAALAVLVVLLNFDFFWQNIHHTFVKPNAQPTLMVQGQKYEPNVLSIESLGIKAPIVYANQTTEKVFQEALKNGVVHYPGTALPGNFGNVYIFGHSSDYIWSKGNFKTVFALLPRINKGDKIEITDDEGYLYTYIVKDSFVASAKDTYLLNQDKSKKILTLQTSYPIGTALKRYIVIAEME